MSELSRSASEGSVQHSRNVMVLKHDGAREGSRTLNLGIRDSRQIVFRSSELGSLRQALSRQEVSGGESANPPQWTVLRMPSRPTSTPEGAAQ
jgi:hypothetical protein